MKLSEFLNTCAIDWDTLYVYTADEEWDSMVPAFSTKSIRDALRADKEVRDAMKFALQGYVDQWEVDKNFNIHVLVTI